MEFDLNALFSKVVKKEDKKPEKKAEESKKSEFNVDTTLTSLKMYEKIDKKMVTENKTDQSKGGDGLDALREMARDPARFDDKIQNKTFLLDKFVKPKASFKPFDKLKPISSKFKKEKKLFVIPEDKVKYELFLKLNSLWKQYAEELILNERTPEQIFTKLLKADYHGAIIKIFQSKCKTYEGISGIVVMETMRSFKIVTPDNRLLTILKQNTIFFVEVLSKTIKIFGCHMVYRPADRLKNKFRLRYMQEIAC